MAVSKPTAPVFTHCVWKGFVSNTTPTPQGRVCRAESTYLVQVLYVFSPGSSRGRERNSALVLVWLYNNAFTLIWLYNNALTLI